MSDTPPDAPAPPPHAPPAPPGALTRATAYYTFGAALWSAATTTFALTVPEVFRWLLFSRSSRYVFIGGALSLMFWPSVRPHVGERGSRAYLGLVATLAGLFMAVLLFALKLTPFLTVLAMASFSFGATVLLGGLVSSNLRKPRRVLEVVRQVAELTLAGVTLGPQLGWLETAVVVLGLAAVLVSVSDDVQALRDDERTVPAFAVQHAAAVRAVDLYLSYFRLTIIFARLTRPPRKRA
jgi:hypothetical protein